MQVTLTEALFAFCEETPLLSREAPHMFSITGLRCKCDLLVYLSAYTTNLPVAAILTLSSLFLFISSPLSPQNTLIYIRTCLLDGDVT